ncbi:MAG TPA: hypothetical protein VFI38_02045 [Candidatus Acidoferrum sp.]|nr:hypothetical protein [Candidatus Acidoferrum sp.]
MSNLSFARIMYGTSQEASSTLHGTASNYPTTLRTGGSGSSAKESEGATVESILHKLWIVLSDKK